MARRPLAFVAGLVESIVSPFLGRWKLTGFLAAWFPAWGAGRIPPALDDKVLADWNGLMIGALARAAAVFDRSGAVQIVREDVGRHNAVDKVVGSMLLAGSLPAAGLGLFVSGRASVEMVQKAWAAGFGTVVAVSAPTALAVEAARRANMVLAGFVRSGRLNVYAPERLA